MIPDTKNLRNRLYQYLKYYHSKGYTLDDLVNVGFELPRIYDVIDLAFMDGYADALSDVKEGLVNPFDS